MWDAMKNLGFRYDPHYDHADPFRIDFEYHAGSKLDEDTLMLLSDEAVERAFADAPYELRLLRDQMRADGETPSDDLLYQVREQLQAWHFMHLVIDELAKACGKEAA